MHSTNFLSALAFTGLAVATTCSTDITITSANQVINCDVVNANIKVDSSVVGDLMINGPKQIKGDLIINNATKLISVTSTTISSIEGTFELQGLELLSTLSMSSLRSLNKITFVKLPQLSGLTFGSNGVTKASSIQVSDTFINDLSGLNVVTVDTFQIDNNSKLTKFNSDLVNVTSKLYITNNGNNMAIQMLSLQMAAEIQLSNIKSFSAPALNKVTASIKFDKNPELTSFAAPNLTNVAEALSFINNKKLANISVPQLTKIGADMTIQNNTNLLELTGFPKLKSVYGGILLGGGFDKVELPSLSDVSGAVTVTSTTDISGFCKFFDDAKSNGEIRGGEKCTSNNTNANTGDGSGGQSGSSNGNTKGSDAGLTTISTAMFLIAAVAGLAQVL